MENKEKKYILKTCQICYGLGGIESANGDVKDCPNVKCQNGYIKVEVIQKDDPS